MLFFPVFFFRDVIRSDDAIQILSVPDKSHCCKFHSHEDNFP